MRTVYHHVSLYENYFLDHTTCWTSPSLEGCTSFDKQSIVKRMFFFFSLRLMNSSTRNPLISFHSISFAFRSVKLTLKSSYDSGKLPRLTVANLFEEISSFISRNCSAREVVYLKCRGGGGSTWPTNIRGRAAGKSKKLPCP